MPAPLTPRRLDLPFSGLIFNLSFGVQHRLTDINIQVRVPLVKQNRQFVFNELRGIFDSISLYTRVLRHDDMGYFR